MVNLLSFRLCKQLIFWVLFRSYLNLIVLCCLSSQSGGAFSSQTVAFNKVLWVLRCVIHSSKIIFVKIGFLVYRIIKMLLIDLVKSEAMQCRYPALWWEISSWKSWLVLEERKNSPHFRKGPCAFCHGWSYSQVQHFFVLFMCYFMR